MLVYHNNLIVPATTVREELAAYGLPGSSIDAYLASAEVFFDEGAKWWEDLQEKTGCEWLTVIGHKLCIGHDGTIHNDGPGKGQHIDDFVSSTIKGDTDTDKKRDSGIFHVAAATLHAVAKTLEAVSNPVAFAFVKAMEASRGDAHLFVGKQYQKLERRYGRTQAHLILAGTSLGNTAINLAADTATAGLATPARVVLAALMGSVRGAKIIQTIARIPSTLAVMGVNWLAGTSIRKSHDHSGLSQAKKDELHERAKAALHYGKQVNDLVTRITTGLKQSHGVLDKGDDLYTPLHDKGSRIAEAQTLHAHDKLQTTIKKLRDHLKEDHPSPARAAALQAKIQSHLDDMHAGLSALRKRSSHVSGVLGRHVEQEREDIEHHAHKAAQAGERGHDLVLQSQKLDQHAPGSKIHDLTAGIAATRTSLQQHRAGMMQAVSRHAALLRHHEGLGKLAAHGPKEKKTFSASSPKTLSPERLDKLSQQTAIAAAAHAIKSFLKDPKSLAKLKELA